jgi:hypothetical protein
VGDPDLSGAGLRTLYEIVGTTFMAKGRSGRNQPRAMQQRIEAGYNIVTSSSVINQPSKAALRASIPVYEESIVKRIDAKPKKKSRK